MVLLASASSVERALREENELLRERLRQLEAILRPPEREETIRVLRGAFGLSRAEGMLLDLLMRRISVSREQYQVACCTEDTTGDSLLSVRICFLRKSLNRYGAEISTMWGHSYSLPEASKKIIRQALNEWFEAGSPSVERASSRRSNREREAPSNVQAVRYSQVL